MKLLTADLRRQLPAIYGQEHATDPIVYARFFLPGSTWEWFITEGGEQDDDFLFFGYVIGQFKEWGYISLTELQSTRSLFGVPIERDLYFKIGLFSQIKKTINGE